MSRVGTKSTLPQLLHVVIMSKPSKGAQAELASTPSGLNLTQTRRYCYFVGLWLGVAEHSASESAKNKRILLP
jgi:hypothetical protein